MAAPMPRLPPVTSASLPCESLRHVRHYTVGARAPRRESRTCALLWRERRGISRARVRRWHGALLSQSRAVVKRFVLRDRAVGVLLLSTSVANARERRWCALRRRAGAVPRRLRARHRPQLRPRPPAARRRRSSRVVGPLVQMGDSWAMVPRATDGQRAGRRAGAAAHRRRQPHDPAVAYAVLAVDFALQLAGATMAIVGIVGAATTHAPIASRSTISPTPNGVVCACASDAT